MTELSEAGWTLLTTEMAAHLGTGRRTACGKWLSLRTRQEPLDHPDVVTCASCRRTLKYKTLAGQ